MLKLCIENGTGPDNGNTLIIEDILIIAGIALKFNKIRKQKDIPLPEIFQVKSTFFTEASRIPYFNLVFYFVFHYF